MQTNVKVGCEIVVTMPDRLGVLSRISTTLAESHVNIVAVCAYSTDGIAHLRLITDDNKKALNALSSKGFGVTEHDVIITEVSPHSIHPEIAPFADSIQPGDNYWCAAAHSGEHAMMVYSLKGNVNLSAVK